MPAIHQISFVWLLLTFSTSPMPYVICCVCVCVCVCVGGGRGQLLPDGLCGMSVAVIG
jgi:hypothetical protein